MYLLTCIQWRLKSACKSAQSDQSVHCPFAFLAIQNVPGEDSDLPAQMCRLIWIFTRHKYPYVCFLVLWLSVCIIYDLKALFHAFLYTRNFLIFLWRKKESNITSGHNPPTSVRYYLWWFPYFTHFWPQHCPDQHLAIPLARSCQY